MKLLDLPPGLCERVHVSFHTDTWPEFDQTCAWLLKEGVPLASYSPEHRQHLRVQIRKKQAFWNGKPLTVTRQNRFLAVSGKDLDVEYTVYAPDFPRV